MEKIEKTPKNKKLMKLFTELYDLVEDVRVEEIAEHIDTESLWAWCGAWRQGIRVVLNDLEREVLLDEGD